MFHSYYSKWKYIKRTMLFVGVMMVLLLSSCQSDDNETVILELPSHFPAPVYDFSNNPITSEGFELGKKLFYDPILSKDSTISCGSCHAQVHGFADHNVAFSTGFGGRLGSRNSPPTVNLIWNTSFMWDGGVNHLEVMPIGPITDPNEMAETLTGIIAKLQNHRKYPSLFSNAFGSKEITSQKLLYAIAQFQGSIISANSRYDDMIQGKVLFTDDEAAGHNVFKENCAACHVPPLFTDFSFKSNGTVPKKMEEGRERITLDPLDYGKFKVPTLRNIELTYPYMHDGRYFTLVQVLDHYQDCHTNEMEVDPILSRGITLTALERKQLLTFLKTLTDAPLLRNNKFSEP